MSTEFYLHFCLSKTVRNVFAAFSNVVIDRHSFYYGYAPLKPKHVRIVTLVRILYIFEYALTLIYFIPNIKLDELLKCLGFTSY